MKEQWEKLRGWGCDIDGAMERVAGDEDLFSYCLKIFVSDENFAQLGESLNKADYVGAFEHAHALKGVAANLGLTPLVKPVSELTELLRGKKDAAPGTVLPPEPAEKLEDLYEQLLARKAEFEALLA